MPLKFLYSVQLTVILGRLDSVQQEASKELKDVNLFQQTGKKLRIAF